MEVTLSILRYNPETDRAQHYENYTLEAELTDQVLDLLNKVKWDDDGTLEIVCTRDLRLRCDADQWRESPGM